MKIRFTDRFRKAQNALANSVGDELVLLEVSSGTYFGLDPVGRRAWELTADGATLQQVFDAMLGEFEVDDATLERDLLLLFERLVESKLLMRENSGQE